MTATDELVEHGPSEAEIEAAIGKYGSYEAVIAERSCAGYSTAKFQKESDEAYQSLLRLIAAQKEAAKREALEAVRGDVCAMAYCCVDDESEYDRGVQEMWKAVVDRIDAMLAKEVE